MGAALASTDVISAATHRRSIVGRNLALRAGGPRGRDVAPLRVDVPAAAVTALASSDAAPWHLTGFCRAADLQAMDMASPTAATVALCSWHCAAAPAHDSESCQGAHLSFSMSNPRNPRGKWASPTSDEI